MRLLFAGDFHDAAAFADVVADRLFDVNVFAGLHGPDGGERVPVVGRGDGNRVDILVIDDFADVLFIPGSGALLLLGDGHGLVDDGRIRVADDRDETVVFAGEAFDVANAATVNADDCDAQRRAGFVGLGGFLLGLRLVGETKVGAGQSGQHRRILDEITSIQKTHKRRSSPKGEKGEWDERGHVSTLSTLESGSIILLGFC